MKQSTLELWVGIFVAIGLAAIAFLSFNIANLSTQSSGKNYTLYAEFGDIGGLKVKAPVKSAGVVIGRITKIELDTKKFVAKVTMNIDDHYQFSQDTSAEILTSGLLGEQYIGLTQGGDETMLANGDQITLTNSALVLEQLLGKFMTNFAEKNAEAD